MIDPRCHSLQQASLNGVHSVCLTSGFRSGSSQDDGSIKSTRHATLTSSSSELLTGSQLSLSLKRKPDDLHFSPRLKENKGAETTSHKRGYIIIRPFLNQPFARKTIHSPILPDRFIPKREFGESPSTPFRVNKNTYQLSSEEKFLRHHVPGDDPFLSNPRRPPGHPGQKLTPLRLRQRPSQRPRLVTDLAVVRSNDSNGLPREVSSRAVWGVGGGSTVLGEPYITSSSPSQRIVGRSTTAPAFAAKFLPRDTATDNQNKHESRLALALDIDRATRLLSTCTTCAEVAPKPTSPDYERFSPFVWKDSAWKKVEREHWPSPLAAHEVVPSKPFRILDAPRLRDDFYCSTLAYSSTADVLAVGLAEHVYLWSEAFAVGHPPFEEVHPSNYVTSLSFSSENGKRSILAVGRRSGQLSLWSVFEAKVRFEISHPIGISCLSFKPKTSRRSSESVGRMEIEAEDLVAGDDMGNIWYYSVEWPNIHNESSWTGSMTLLAKISAHTQQVCGLAWSPDERILATGGNDNACMLFDLCDILPALSIDHPALTTTSAVSSKHLTIRQLQCLALGLPNRQQIVRCLLPSWSQPSAVKPPNATPLLSHKGCLLFGNGKTMLIPVNREKHRLLHSAAVKAIAFAPWQPSLLATGGGSNDRSIHFFHTRTGACLATINVFAQVTSLIWSKNRREIAATLGYAVPEHPFRIAVFSWPSCAQVAVIPWGPYGTSWDECIQEVGVNCGRALCAVSYPGRASHFASDESDDAPYQSPAFSIRPSQSRSPGRERILHRRPRRDEGVVRSMRGRSGSISPAEKEGGMWCKRTLDEGCIIVASSDQTVKFHEVWTGGRKSTGISCGLLGGSDILEAMEGIEKTGDEVIR